jgi:hypothetical protein
VFVKPKNLVNENQLKVVVFHIQFAELYNNCIFAFHGNMSKLNPQKTGALECKDFRPISLVIGIFKIIAKVLANRLRMVLEKVVSTSQNAFIWGHQILDSELIANESLDSRMKSGIHLCLYLFCPLLYFSEWQFKRFLPQFSGSSSR